MGTHADAFPAKSKMQLRASQPAHAGGGAHRSPPGPLPLTMPRALSIVCSTSSQSAASAAASSLEARSNMRSMFLDRNDTCRRKAPGHVPSQDALLALQHPVGVCVQVRCGRV